MNIDMTTGQKIYKAKYDGFTLIEIILVMLITSVLVLGINGAYRQAHLIWSRVENDQVIYQKSRLLIETLREELACMYFPQGTAQQQLIPCYISTLPDGTTEISYHTLAPSWKRSPIASYPARVCYKFYIDSETDQRLLRRTEQYFSGEKPIAAESKEIILDGLGRFNVWAIGTNSDFSPDSWRENLECITSPPKAIKIQLNWPDNGNSIEHSFQCTIAIPCQSKLSLQ